MKKYILYTLLLIPLLAECYTGHANAPLVSINLQVVPPYPTRLTDLAEQPGKVIMTLQNLSQQPLTIYLRVSISGDNGISGITDPNYVPPTGITLQANQIIQADYQTIRNLFDVNHIKFQGIKVQDIIQKQGVPEGIYQICVQAYDFRQPGAALSDPAPFGCSTFRLVTLEPPILIKPMEEEELTLFTPQNVIFSWTMPAGAPPGTRYRLRIVEMLDAKRNINDAFLSATQPTFFEKTVQGNIYVYTPVDPPLVQGRKYAWAVTALDENYYQNRVSREGNAFRNNGRSEVRGFIVGKKTDNDNRGVAKVPEKNTTRGKTKFTPNPKYAALNQNTFKGQLTWAFRKTEMGTFASSISIKDMGKPAGSIGVSTSVEQALNTYESSPGAVKKAGKQKAYGPSPKGNSSNNNSLSGGTLNTGNADGAMMNIVGGGAVTNAIFINGTGALATAEKDYQQELQNQINELADDKHYPLANTDVELHLYINPEMYKKWQALQKPLGESNIKTHILLGKTKTDAQGNFNLNYHGEMGIGYDLELVINNPYFTYSNIGIKIQTDTNGIYDVGEVLGLADTYRLKVQVTDDDGNKLDAAKVDLLRTGGFYDKNAIAHSLEHEVMRDELTDKDKDEYRGGKSGYAKQIAPELAGTAKCGETFTRLFLNQSYNDRYLVRLSFEKATPKTYNLFVSSASGGYVENGVPVIEKKYVLSLPNPMVTGRVVSKTGGIPIKDATVMVSPKSTEGMTMWQIIFSSYTVKTDAEGKFNIENITPSDKPYQLQVLYKSKTYTESKPLFLTRKGATENRDPVFITAALTTVCGSVTDAPGNAITGAALHWKEGGDVFYTDDKGQFLSSQTEGKHIVIVQSPGYKDLEQEIEVKASTDKGKTPIFVQTENMTDVVNNWSAGTTKNAGGLTAGMPSTIQKMTGTGKSGRFENGVTAEQAAFKLVFNGGDIVTNEYSCNHTLVMTRFFVKATVKDAATGKPVQNATVQVQFASKSFTTNKDGVAVLSDVPSGSPQLITKGPADALYESAGNIITVDNTKDTVAVDISLKAGSKAAGQVLSKGAAVKNATVYVVGKDYISATTDDQGKYSLTGVPAGEYTLRGAKEGLLADDSVLNFLANQSYTVDFSLTDPGFNATSLYGFKLNLFTSKPGPSPDEFIISGELTDLPDNPVFKKMPGEAVKLPFTDLTIIKTGSTIKAKNGEVKTDVSEIQLQAFGYAVVKLSTGDGLRVKPRSGDITKGEVSGEISLDLLKTFSSLAGWKAPSLPIALTSGSVSNIGAITSDGALSATSFKLGGSITGFSIYNIELQPDLENSTISAQGLKFKGSLKLDKIPLLNDVTLKLNEIDINKNGKVTKVDIALDPQPVLKLLSWSLKVNGVNLDQYGLKFSGNMDVPIPGSPVAQIGFNNLSVGESGISAGSFFMPDAGINIYNLVSFKSPAGTEFSLQKMPGSTHYQLIGGGTFSVPKFIKKELVLDNFNVSTNGNFGATAKVDFTVGFADMANLTINKVGFNTASKEIIVGGKFKLSIPNFGIGAQGTIHYKPGSVSVDDLGIEFNLSSAIAMAATVKFKNENEFGGEGYLKLAGLLDGVGLGFSYKKLPGGIDVNASFKTGMVIPLGLVKLDNLGGGFGLNTATSTYTVFASGRITAAPDPVGLIAMDPVKLTISSTPAGPVLTGEAEVKVLTSWKVAQAVLKIDFPNKQFYIDAKMGAGFNLMKGIGAQSDAGVHMELNAKDDLYWFVSAYTNTSIAHIFSSGVTIAAGWNVPRTAHPSLSSIPDFVLSGGRLYGGYFGASTNLNLTSPDVGVKDIASVKGWYRYNSDVKVYANFKAPAFGIKFDGAWEAGGEADFVSLPVASASIAVKGGFDGNYSSAGWGIGGSLSADVSAHIGCDGGCNGITWGCCFNACLVGCEVCPCPCGAKICVGGTVNVSYNSGDGLHFGLSVF